MSVYFRSYTENTIMEYELFLKYCRDFGIFPDLCSKVILHSTFYSLTSANNSVTEGVNPRLGILSIFSISSKPLNALGS